MSSENFLDIFRTSETLNLPAAFIRREAVAGRIPSIRIGRRFMFDVAAVRRALVAQSERANGGGAKRSPRQPERAGT